MALRQLAPILVAVLLSAVTAAAANLGGVVTDPVASGSAAVGSCDGDGVTISYTTSGGKVTEVTIGDVADPGCQGGEMKVTLVDSGDAGIGSGGSVTVPTDGDTSPDEVVLSISPQPDAELVDGHHVAITGP